MKLNERGILVVLSGPSGVGKGTVRSALFKIENHNLVYSVSVTTRKPRGQEKEGIDYYFVSEDEFIKKVDKGEFLEYTKFVGNYYGTLKESIDSKLSEGSEVILEIEVDGALQVKEKMPGAVFVFIAPPSLKDLEKRLIERGTESSYELQARLEKAKNELKLAYLYDYIVINDTVENAADKILAIIRAEHAKTERTINTYYKMLEVKQ
ncbi:MAG: guanylate kinase [Bacilli bacterium]|nr:guanylate kinase [Bacilli bacterium]